MSPDTGPRSGAPRKPFPGLTEEAGSWGGLRGGSQEETNDGYARILAHQLCDYRVSLLATSTSSPLLLVYDIELPVVRAGDSASPAGVPDAGAAALAGGEMAARRSADP